MSEFILTGYIESALVGAEYDKLGDGTSCGTILSCRGIILWKNAKAMLNFNRH
jgi:hypothetical protein